MPLRAARSCLLWGGGPVSREAPPTPSGPPAAAPVVLACQPHLRPCLTPPAEARRPLTWRPDPPVGPCPRSTASTTWMHTWAPDAGEGQAALGRSPHRPTRPGPPVKRSDGGAPGAPQGGLRGHRQSGHSSLTRCQGLLHKEAGGTKGPVAWAPRGSPTAPTPSARVFFPAHSLASRVRSPWVPVFPAQPPRPTPEGHPTAANCSPASLLG